MYKPVLECVDLSHMLYNYSHTPYIFLYTSPCVLNGLYTAVEPLKS